MSVEAVTSAGSTQAAQDSGQGASNSDVQSLIRLEQDVRKMKSDLESKVKLQKVPQTDVQSKIKEYDKLIAQIEQQIQQVRQQESKKSVSQPKKAVKGAVTTANRQDRTVLSVAALNASYQSLPLPTAETLEVPAAPATTAEPSESKYAESETEASIKRELNQLA
jgi:hypothetical protein